MSYNEQLRCDDLTTNYEGEVAWKMTPEMELYTATVTMMGVSDTFYERSDDRVNRVADLVRRTSPEFVARLAVYAREEMHIRSVPLLLLVELSRCHSGDSLVSRAIARTIKRADEITELLMCYQWRTGSKNLKKISVQLRKGLAEAFNHFDEYQFAKYDRTDRKVTFRDALILVHPRPKDAEQSAVFKKILKGELTTAYTWESETSRAGTQHFESNDDRDNAMKKTWQELVSSGRLGYMAMLRNLRKMSLLCVDEDTKSRICRILSDENQVRKSRQLPYRFLSAYMQLLEENLSTSVQPFRPIRKIALFSRIKQQLKNTESHLLRKLESIRPGRPKCLANTATISGGLQSLKVPYLPDPRWEKDAMLEKKLTKMVRNIRKRYSKMHNLTIRYNQAEIYDVDSEIKRCRKRLKEQGVSWNQHVKPFLDALEEAVKHTAGNIPGFDSNTRVLLASDTSYSMRRPVSLNSSIQCYHIGLLLSMIMRRRCENVVTGMFASFWEPFQMSSDKILSSTLEMISLMGKVGYFTNGYKVIKWLIDNEIVMDKVMLFTDCQLWGSRFAEYWELYKEEVAPNARLYIFDLVGYGQSPIDMKRDDVFCIAGWSDKIFDILAACENSKSAIDEIRRIVI